MVMEPLPPQPSSGPATSGSRSIHSSPQLNPHFLGREFVRQYYTLLNQSPGSLYRFYAEDSSLVHGSLSKNAENDPVYGQAEIQRRIMSLCFRDCHAKIIQVDSLETLERGVVVQVSGELSNNGEPMRRFFQTFVLAPRSPTNYYVRNDIFRYQDEADEEDCADLDKAELEMAAKAVIEATLSAPDTAVDTPKQVNGHQDNESKPLRNQEIVTDSVSIAPPAVKEEPLQPAVAASAPTSRPTKPTSQSWAARVADSGLAPSPLLAPRAQDPVPPPQTSPVAMQAAAAPPSNASTPPKGAKDLRRGRPKVKPEKGDAPAPTGVTEPTDSLPDDKKTAVTYGDEQQVFVGNLPQDITEDELRKFFSKYGNIVDVRINRTNQKSSAGRTPNYGFVTFEDTKIVKHILSQKPIYFNEHRFNVEEKRSQGRGSNMNRSASGAGLGVSRGSNFAGDAKMQRPGRGKDMPRDRPFADRSERLSGDSGSGHMNRKLAASGAAASGNNGAAAGTGAGGVHVRQSFHTNNKR